MKFRLILLPLLLLAAINASAQQAFDPAESRDELSLSVGMLTSMQRGVNGYYTGTDLALQMDYRHFWRSGLGVSSGIVFSPDYQGFENTFGIPVSLVWRTGEPRGRGRLDRGLNAAGSTIRDRSINYSYGNKSTSVLGAGLASFFMNIFSRAEFFAGLTPGWIPGDEDIYRSNYKDGSWEESGMQKPHSFALTADAGAALTYRIWRFNLRLTPAVHYSLINNYRDYSATYRPNYPAPLVSTQDLRWHFSFQFGVGYLF